MKTIYIQGTKVEANTRLKNNLPVPAREYNMLNETAYSDIRAQLKENAVVKFWIKKDPVGNPIAKSYGNWVPNKGKII